MRRELIASVCALALISPMAGQIGAASAEELVLPSSEGIS